MAKVRHTALAQRLGRWLTQQFAFAEAHARRDAEAIPLPRLGILEPRIVLNATAELTGLGLSILGDSADDTVNVALVDNGTALQLFDGLGSIIPITGHTSGATGSETDPLALTDLSADTITVDLGGGDDLLQIELADAIHLDVTDSGGDDTVELNLTPDGTPSPPSNINIVAERIDLTPTGPTVQFADRAVTLTGDVFAGGILGTSSTRLDIGSGSLTVAGSLQLDGTVQVFGTSGSVDFTAARIEATASDVDLFFEFDDQAGSLVELGFISDLGTDALDEVQVVSATDIVTTDDILIAGDFTLSATGDIDVLDEVIAAQIEISGETVTVSQTLFSEAGPTVLSATDTIDLQGDIDSTVAGGRGQRFACRQHDPAY